MAVSVMDKTPEVANVLTTTNEGYILDARQGKALSDLITNLKIFPDQTNILYDTHTSGAKLSYTATVNCYICAWTLDRANMSFKLNDQVITTTATAAVSPSAYSTAVSFFLKPGDVFVTTGVARCIVMGLR